MQMIHEPFEGDVNDKAAWIAQGERWEKQFVEEVCGPHELAFSINPGKALDPTLPDLIYTEGRRCYVCDLKCVFSPFGTEPDIVPINTHALSSYAIPGGSHAATAVAFWVEWEEQVKHGEIVPAKQGVWTAPVSKLAEQAGRGELRIYEYPNRRNDRLGNAKSSYLLDLREMRRWV